jgi:hypothetical protein
MTIKTLEVRDSGTNISVMAIQMLGSNSIQRYFIHDRTGHPKDGSSIVVMCLDGKEATNDPYEWSDHRLNMGPRTLPVAHNYIIEHWEHLSDGDVVDVEWILGETSSPKQSERLP